LKIVRHLITVSILLLFILMATEVSALSSMPRNTVFEKVSTSELSIDIGVDFDGEIGYKTGGGEEGSVQLTGGRGIVEWPGTQQMLVYFHPVEEDSRFHGKLFHIKDNRGQVRVKRIPLWVSILPPLIAIFFALLFREVIISLFAGVVIGAWAFFGFSFFGLFRAILKSVEFFILETFTDSGHAAVIIFSMLIGGMVAIISRNGGMLGVVNWVSRYANSARNAQLVTWFMGIAIFFDDYANTLIVGNTFRPVTDKFKISREKLAYIVDSTAAPIAAIALVTTWIGAELGYIKDAIDITGLDASEYLLFLQSLKYSYYPVLTILFIFMLIWMNRDFSSMFKAEHRARTTGKVTRDDGIMKELSENLDPDKGIPNYAFNAVIPVAVVIGMTILGLVITGMNSLHGDIISAGGVLNSFAWKEIWANLHFLFNAGSHPDFFMKIGKLIGSADSYTALLWASASGVSVAIFLSLLTKTLSMENSMNAMLSGFKTMLPTMLILILAWSLAKTTDVLHTADFLIAALSDNLQAQWMPLITFVLAGLISFSTGSSWSTMAILYPLALPLTWNLGLGNGMEEAALMPIFHNVIAVVLAGSVLGDHCSPISDTTVLSSLASSCDHIDHVRTQLPYALTVGMVSVLMGGVIFAIFPLPWYLNYIIGAIILFVVIRVYGKEVPQPV